ncbi:MAG TPA: MMPL family transporter [Caulobacteraceae bacterium]|nr:MMPL family transporter [Caulobacteraceae bacterium]
MTSRPTLIGRLVALCADQAWIVLALVLALGVGAAMFAVGHFAMSTDTNALLSPKLPWKVREAAFNRAFPPAGSQIVVVVDGQTPELAEQGAAALAAKLRSQPQLFHAVRQPDAGPFWAHEGLLYLSLQDVQSTTAQLIQAQPFLGPIAADPSIRGLMGALSTALQGVSMGQASLDDIHKPISKLADALESLRAGKPTFFSWQTLISNGPPDPREMRHVILVDPSLDFTKLEPGSLTSQAIRDDAKALYLDPAHGVRVRLTGPIPLQDEEFGSLADHAGLIGLLAVSAITLMLWMAVRAARLIGSILVTTFVGLVCAAALGLLIFHTFNAISVAFIPLFVGLGIDFGIQFSVRYRAEHLGVTSVRDSLIATGNGMGRSLALAATAIACGFLAFAPTDYYGVSQLGVIAGMGMFIALALNLTFLPALIRITQPPGAPERGTHPSLSRIDDFVLGHRRLVIGTGVGAALVSAALLPLLHFDFNPMHLRNPHVESMQALADLMQDPNEATNTLEYVAPNLAAADAVAAKVRTLPVVADARTLSSFVPADQPAKIAVIADAYNLLDLTLSPPTVAAPPTDAEVVDSLNQTASALRQAAGTTTTLPAVDARRLASDLERLAKAGPAARAQAAQVLMPGLTVLLDQVRGELQPRPISLKSLPPDLVRDWVTPDGRARVSMIPKGDSNNDAVLTRFIKAVQPLVPDVTGAALGIHEGGATIVGAFVEAGVLSFVAISLLLLLVLRRVRDVAITMAPIVLTGLLTMGSCVVIGQPLNFANIIALPLLFGIGVAFHIYFVMSWRSGGSHLLTSSLARAVFFSALTTATGFGSLWASSHPGTASMGELLMISLLWTLVSALLFQPALMGPPPAVPEPAPEGEARGRGVTRPVKA